MPIAYRPIGNAHQDGPRFFIEVEPAFRQGLVGLGDFSFIHVVWHAHEAAPLADDALVLTSPYRNAPEKLGVFATRSSGRPNPVCITVAPLLGVDITAGRVDLAWIDCENGTPVLDIKPYHTSSDRIAAPKVPHWCENWPKSLEESANFDWSKVFNF